MDAGRGYELLDIEDVFDGLGQEYYLSIGRSHLNELSTCINRTVADTDELDAIYYKDGKKEWVKDGIKKDGVVVLDGDKIAGSWFPTADGKGKFDVFLSHSHLDENKAIALAGLFAKYNLNVFIDSCVWGYFAKLLKILDDKYCVSRTRENCYDYDKHNAIMSHVFSMLSTALFKMIDQTGCVIFMKTENSVIVDGDGGIFDGADNLTKSTFSPWIYQEILATKLIEKHQQHLKESIFSCEVAKSIDVNILREIDTSHLEQIHGADISRIASELQKAHK